MKQIKSIILSIILFAGIFCFMNPADVQASDVIKIYSETDLNNVRNNPTADYILMNDIIFEDEDFQEGGNYYNDGSYWTPIDFGGEDGSGTFDGNGFSIQNLRGTLLDENKGTIKNLGMVDVKATQPLYSAGLCENNYGLIEECYVTGVVGSTSSDYAGGIVDTNNGTIRKCYNVAPVTGKSVGGITQNNIGLIEQCYNVGKVTANRINYSSGSWSGGITANNHGTIKDCFNAGVVYPYLSGWYGGITALNQSPTGGTANIINCYNAGDLSSSNSTGGIAAYNFKSTTAEFTNCYYIERYNVKYGIY